MDKMIEVRYAGAVVGRSAIVRELDTQGLFLGMTEPMPVGTEVTLKVGDESAAGKVAMVSESQELARAGMRVRFLDASAAALFGTPTEATAEPEAIAPVAAPATPAPRAPASEITVVGGPDAVRFADARSGAPAASPASRPSEDGALQAAPPSAPSGGHRRIVVDASSDQPAPAEAATDEPELSGPVAGGTGPAAAGQAGSGQGGPGDGRKSRRNKRR